jgi:hypothetical protein
MDGDTLCCYRAYSSGRVIGRGLEAYEELVPTGLGARGLP